MLLVIPMYLSREIGYCVKNAELRCTVDYILTEALVESMMLIKFTKQLFIAMMM